MSDVKTDCFAYRSGEAGRDVEHCEAMNALYCKTGECKFYKTAQQACHECTYSNCSGCVNPLATGK